MPKKSVYCTVHSMQALETTNHWTQNKNLTLPSPSSSGLPLPLALDVPDRQRAFSSGHYESPLLVLWHLKLTLSQPQRECNLILTGELIA